MSLTATGVTVMHRRASVPARINIIGEHTDYLGGLALPFASNVRLTLTAKTAAKHEGEDTIVKLWQAAGGWPARLEIDSEIPIGAGMSSSAALCLAIVLCANGSMDPMKACLEAQRIEHKVLDTPCGLLDQMAMMFSSEGYASLIDFSTNDVKPFQLPENWVFKLVDSGVRRELGTTDYGGSIAQATLEKHAREEDHRVTAALKADANQLGILLNESHQSLRTIGVSHDVVDALVADLQATPGVLGARMMGGGFGGMILALVDHPHVIPESLPLVASEAGFVEEFFE